MPRVHGLVPLPAPGPDAGLAASAVLMVRPASFGWNPETQASNSYQRPVETHAHGAAVPAREEFDAVVRALRVAGIDVHAFDDREQPVCPDAVFPNNWISFHADGTVVLYPMLAPNRRLERRVDVLRRLGDQGSFDIRRLVDLTRHESTGAFLEGTGSLVLDHSTRTAYACASPRTHEAPLREFCDELGFEPCIFRALDAAGRPVYHTNVVLSVGPSLVVVSTESLVDDDRERVLERLAKDGREVVQIDRRQAADFAANVLELRSRDGARVLAMSESALQAFEPHDHARLRSAVERIVSVPVPVIEALGGGSVRCMLAEIFLPRRADA